MRYPVCTCMSPRRTAAQDRLAITVTRRYFESSTYLLTLPSFTAAQAREFQRRPFRGDEGLLPQAPRTAAATTWFSPDARRHPSSLGRLVGSPQSPAGGAPPQSPHPHTLAFSNLNPVGRSQTDTTVNQAATNKEQTQTDTRPAARVGRTQHARVNVKQTVSRF